MRVLKFGGSSLANADRIRDVGAIVLEAVKDEPVVVVVSALYGITNKLHACAKMAAAGNNDYQAALQELIQQHYQVIAALLPEQQAPVNHTCKQLLDELSEILQGIFLVRELTPGAMDHIASFGERLSANIMAAYLNQTYPAEFVDARKMIFTDNQHSAANVLFEETNAAISKYYDEHVSSHPVIPVVTGFIASTRDGRTTTLGRNSSDYTATIFGGALNASRIEIWTDVDGVYSADPNLVKNAFILPYLSYLEAIELSYFGGKVMHALTFQPVMHKDIPILIKNTMNPESHGTFIVSRKRRPAGKRWAAKSVTAIDDISLLIWKTTGAADVSHVKERLFRCLALANIQTYVELEGSPKNTVYIAIKHHDYDKAQHAIQHEFHLEFKHQLVTVEERASQCIIAIIGDEIKKLPPEIAGKMFQYLGRIGIHINAMVYGASDRSLCLVVDNVQRVRTLNLIHHAFFSECKSLAVLMIGAGRVGKELLKQLLEQQQAIADKKIHLSICAISNSKKMISNLHGVDLANYEKELQQSHEPFAVSAYLKILPQLNYSNIALLDCTASQEIVDAYPLFIQEGVHVITPNKRANVLPYSEYKALRDQFKRHHSMFLYRANVGAGLPVLSILKDLMDCGDNIVRIEGIFSGTLSYVFNHYDGSVPFGRVLQKAHELQLTEPDPREDLSGTDVGRKLLILARNMGWKVELSDVTIESLVPEALAAGPFTDAFFTELDKYESTLLERMERCRKENKVLRYTGVIDVANHTLTAKLAEIPNDHPLALSTYSDNIIAFSTNHYHTTPLVIRGPGAGVECTASGVFSDILDLIGHLPE